MITEAFVQRTRARIAEARAVLTGFRVAHKEAVQQLTKIAGKQTSDTERLYDKLGDLAEDVVNKLPDEAEESDFEKAREIQEQINDLASEVEELSLGRSAIEDLGGDLAKDLVSQVFVKIKELETELSAMERRAAKLKI